MFEVESEAGRDYLAFRTSEFEQKREIQDVDKDGWCDLWASFFPIPEGAGPRTVLTDHDGDGLTDYEEMVLMQDPYTPNEFPRYKSPRELADEAKARGTTLLATAWETEVDRPILAGAVPEPSVLGLLGLSTLLSVTRRRGARC